MGLQALRTQSQASSPSPQGDLGVLMGSFVPLDRVGPGLLSTSPDPCSWEHMVSSCFDLLSHASEERLVRKRKCALGTALETVLSTRARP